MLFYRTLIYLILLYIPVVFIYNGYQSSGQVFEENTVWYQDFRDNPKFNLNLTLEKYPEFKRNFYASDRMVAYFNEKGEIKHKIFLDNQSLVSVQNGGYILYKKLNDLITFYDNSGKEKWSYSTFAYPHLTPIRNNILLFSTDNTLLSMIDRHQSLLLPETYLGTMITDIAFCPYNDNFVVSTIDSKLYYYSYTGKKIFENEIKSSRYNYIKTVGCSYSSDKIIALSGLKPEKLVLMDKGGFPLWEQETGVERRTKVSLKIDEINQRIYDQRGLDTVMLSLNNGELIKSIKLDNKLSPIHYTLFSHEKDYLLAGHNRDIHQTVTLYDMKGNVVWNKVYKDFNLRYIEVKREVKSINLLIILNSVIYVYQLKNLS